MKTLLFIIFAFSIQMLCAQTGYWAESIGGTNNVYGLNITTDDTLNIYIAGHFLGEAYFGTTTLVSSGGSDIFVAKLDPDGNWLWAKRAGGTSSDNVQGICVDSSGNIYITGSFQGAAYFGSDAIVSNGSYDIYVAKLDNSGFCLWAIGVGSTDYDYGSAITLDDNDNIYVTGMYTGTVTFDGPLTSLGGRDIFVAKMNSAAAWYWVVSCGGTGTDYSDDIAVDSSGNCCIAGSFENTAAFGPFSLVSSGSGDVYVAKVNSDGNWQWATRAGGTSEDEARGLDMDNDGNCYVTGQFYGTADFNVAILSSVIPASSDMFVAKVNFFGIWQWAKKGGGSSSEYGYGIDADDDGNCYVIGTYQSNALFGEFALPYFHTVDTYVAKLSSDGNWLWAGNSECTLDAFGIGIVNSGDGSATIIGYYSGIFEFAGLAINNIGSVATFLVKFGDPVPAIPQNVTISNHSNDIHIAWDEVTSDTSGKPLTPDYYFIYYNYDQVAGGTYYYLDYTPADIQYYVHQYAGLYSTAYFYNVTAIKYFGDAITPRELDNYLNQHLRSGMSKDEVEAILRDINMF